MNNNKLPINTKVKIHSYLTKYYGKPYFHQLKGSIAYVRAVYSNNYALEVAGLYNEGAKSGYFYLTKDDFDVIELPDMYKEDKSNMNINDFKGEYVVVDVLYFDSNRTYQYRLYKNDCHDYKVDDIVVVKTAHHGMAVAKITKFVDDQKDKTDGSREIICPVMMQPYQERCEKAKKIADLKAEMDKKVKELQGVQLYELMAKYSPELKSMLDEYKAMTGLRGNYNEDQA